ncbi:GNAT family N-acetyltransferase [Micromonospora sp. NPDC049799]|uniref:GNAT family N-acetyltransferase n=1 Tax=Micromonospora sp. NPDC049799 TaxID=3154741 RepID=UPI0033E7F1F2
MTEYPQEVVQRFHGGPEQLAAGLVGEPPRGWRSVVIEDYEPAWADRFVTASSAIGAVLGDLVLDIEHVGSTSVPGLAAKPIIDIDLLLEDTTDESRYVPALEGIGYRLVLREPWWHGHRMLVSKTDDVNLHVWPQGAPEPTRHRLLRDWLRSHPKDRDLYAATKRRLAHETAERPSDYSLAKNDVIDQILGRVFAAASRPSGTDLGGRPVRVRTATLDDLESVIDVHTQARLAYYEAGGLAPEAVRDPALVREQRNGWTEAIRSPVKRVLCATADGEIVGIGAMGPPHSADEDAGSVGQLYQIHVLPGRWGNGVGSTLHAAFVSYLAEAALQTGLLEVWERNARARSFYARHGWEPDGRSRPGPLGAPYVQMRLTVPRTAVGR